MVKRLLKLCIRSIWSGAKKGTMGLKEERLREDALSNSQNPVQNGEAEPFVQGKSTMKGTCKVFSFLPQSPQPSPSQLVMVFFICHLKFVSAKKN